MTAQTKSNAPATLLVRTKIRAGAGIQPNHGLRIRTKVRAGGFDTAGAVK